MSQKKITAADIVNSSLINVGDVSSGSLTEKVVNGVPTSATGWTLTGDFIYQGGYFAINVNSGSGDVYQDIAVTAGYYYFTYNVRYSEGGGTEVQVTLGGNSTYFVRNQGNSVDPIVFTGVVYLPATETVRVNIHGNRFGAGLQVGSISLIQLGNNTISTGNLDAGLILGGNAYVGNLYQANSYYGTWNRVIDDGNISAQHVSSADSASALSDGSGVNFMLMDNTGFGIPSLDYGNRFAIFSDGITPGLGWSGTSLNILNYQTSPTGIPGDLFVTDINTAISNNYNVVCVSP